MRGLRNLHTYYLYVVSNHPVPVQNRPKTIQLTQKPFPIEMNQDKKEESWYSLPIKGKVKRKGRLLPITGYCFLLFCHKKSGYFFYPNHPRKSWNGISQKGFGFLPLLKATTLSMRSESQDSVIAWGILASKQALYGASFTWSNLGTNPFCCRWIDFFLLGWEEDRGCIFIIY